MTSAPTITVASYNMRKAIGLDRPPRPAPRARRAARDRRRRRRAAGGRQALRRARLGGAARADRQPRPLQAGASRRPPQAARSTRPRKHADRLLKVNTRNIGWHGNAILVKRHIGVLDCAALDLPTLEPRGAVMAELLIGDRPLRVVGMHLDLSGLWRRRQMRAILDAIADAAAEDADGADGRHQRMARRGRLPQGSRAATSTSPRPARASTPATRSPRSTGSSSTRTSISRPPACT